jgi:integrase
MGRKSAHDLPPGIQLDKNGVYWATLEGVDARRWRDRYPGRTVPRRKAANRDAAIRLQGRLIRDLDSGRDPNAENPTVAAWVKTWIDGKQSLKPSTLKRYRQSLKWQIEPHQLSRLRLSQITPERIEAWIRALKTHHTRPKKKGGDTAPLDPHSIRNAFALLRAALNTAVDRNRLAKNPCRGVELPRTDHDEIHPLTADESNHLLASLDALVLDKKTKERHPHRNAALYHVAIRCGLRQGELLGLRWTDIDFTKRVLYIGGQLQSGTRTSGKSPRAHRAVPLTTDIVNVLKQHQKNQSEERAISAEAWNKHNLVFVTENGTPMNSSNVDRQFDAFLRRFKLPDVRFHDLRHTYAALSLSAGVDLFTLSRRMGHSSISVTADRYGHLYHGNHDDADSLDRLLKRGA